MFSRWQQWRQQQDTYIADGCQHRCQWCAFMGYTVALYWHEMYDHWDRCAYIKEA